MENSRTWPSRIATCVLVGAPMLVLAVAGVAKLLDVERFERDLRGWLLLPRRTLPFLALAIPTVELGLSMAWIVWRRLSLAVSAGVLYSVFVAVAAGHQVFSHPPPCGCFGVIDAYFQHLGEGRVLILRNLAMLAMLLGGLWVGKGGWRAARFGLASPSSN
jgi:hypothetical protein